MIKLSLIPRSQAHLRGIYVLVEELLSDLVAHHVYDDVIIEMSASGVNKAVGVQEVLKKVNPNRIVIAGDNHNDVPMFLWGNQIGAETYAVGNAVDELKKWHSM